jgi:hypothetical protein
VEANTLLQPVLTHQSLEGRPVISVADDVVDQVGILPAQEGESGDYLAMALVTLIAAQPPHREKAWCPCLVRCPRASGVRLRTERGWEHPNSMGKNAVLGRGAPSRVVADGDHPVSLTERPAAKARQAIPYLHAVQEDGDRDAESASGDEDRR